jgi:hypothetical protein
MALSVTVVLLGATASSAMAARTLDPGSVDFGNRQVGTTSPPQTHTLRAYCDAPPLVCVIIALGGGDPFTPSISTTGDFAQTNNCVGTLQGASPQGQSCTIQTTFTPTSVGPKQGILSTGGPADPGPTATLTGTGVTTPTPPTPPEPGPPTAPLPPPTLDLTAKKQKLKNKLTFFATTNVATTLDAGGSVKATRKQLAGGQKTKVQAKLKSAVRKKVEKKLDNSGKAKVIIDVAATDQAGNSAFREIKIKLTD